MKKKLLILIFINLIMFLGIYNVNAGTLSISGNNSVYVNSTIKVTVSFKNLAGRFKIASSNTSILVGGNEDFYDNVVQTFYFTAKSVGKTYITVTPIGNVGDYDSDSAYTGGSRSLYVNVIPKSYNSNSTIDANKNYSKNNYLKSLSVEGFSISPTFDKDKLEYSVTLAPGSESITINAEKEDKNANIKGTGTIEVTDGTNTLNVVVTAENGNEKTYVIKAYVEEKDPIKVSVNGEYYTIVKRKKLLTKPDGYEESTIKIKNFDIPAFYNEVTGVTLIGLKNMEGKISLFSYDSKTGNYYLYNEFSFDKMNLYIHEDKKSKYEKIKININDSEVSAYKIKGINDYCLLYATNTTTGNEGYYLYDKKENSVQRYDSNMLDNLVHEKDKYLSIVLVMSSVCFLCMLFLLIEVNRDNKRKSEEN